MKSSIYSLLATALLVTADATSDLTLLAAHHVVHSYPGLTPPASLLTLTRQGKVGGIILFGENVDDNLPAVVASFQTAYTQSPGYNGLPLLILTDQEGGQVRRLPGGPESSAKEVGESADPGKAATQAGKDAASTLKGGSVNGNLAPVLDVFREAGDFTDAYERSFGNTSALVNECGSAFITSQQAAGVLACAKHFPGLGAAAKDANTDVKPVTITLTLDELRSVDEAPYKGAIAAGVDMVMASWALYPALDAKMPSGLSVLWVQGELRQRLGFKGVTITDAIEAGSLKAFGNDAQRGVLASAAGMDIILASGRNATQGEAILDALVAALGDGKLSAADFGKGTDRILALRKKLVV
jgi:beta-glucosidase-like glycosyl hydrolase